MHQDQYSLIKAIFGPVDLLTPSKSAFLSPGHISLLPNIPLLCYYKVKASFLQDFHHSQVSKETFTLCLYSIQNRIPSPHSFGPLSNKAVTGTHEKALSDKLRFAPEPTVATAPHQSTCPAYKLCTIFYLPLDSPGKLGCAPIVSTRLFLSVLSSIHLLSSSSVNQEIEMRNQTTPLPPLPSVMSISFEQARKASIAALWVMFM